MFLKSLTLKGFKSFADATTLDFEPGVTVVVGPNGSGKSNVVDAVAWVLGAQGPRALRSTKMEDVIFAGTPSRPALGRAEVSLTIDNSSGLLPIEFSEVTITRRLFRTGESEYAINRVPCRLLDIQDLLSDSGVGRQQHVIVAQGNLDAVLASRPEDRRAVIEEAAGVLKYRRRKERAERRLEATEGSLVRLQDLLREVRRQLRPLEKQADAARRHGDLVVELDAVRRYLAGRDLAAVEVRLAAAARDRTELQRSEEELRRALSGLDVEVLAAETELGAARDHDERVDLGEAVSRAEGLRGRIQGTASVLTERARSTARELAVTVDHDVVASLEGEAASLAAQLAATRREAEELAPAAAEVDRVEQAVAAEAAEVDARWSGETRTTGDPAAEVRGELIALRRAVERAGDERRRLETWVATAEQRAQRSSAERTRLEAVVAEADAARPALQAAVDQALAAGRDGEEALGGAEEARRRADAERHRWAAREEALAQALDAARARAGAERLAAVAGVVGTLLELVEVDEGWEAAFEAAAGEVLAAVVVDGEAAARAGLAELHRQASEGSVIALRGPVGPRPGPRPDRPAGTTPLRDHVRGWLPGVGDLLDRLLADAVTVEGGWADAVDVAIARPDLLVVTRNGDRFAGGLWRAGQGGAGATGAAVRDARGHAEQAEAAAERAEAAAAQAKVAAESRRAVVVDSRRALESTDSRKRAAADTLRRVASDADDAAADLAGASTQLDETRVRLARDESRVAELETLLPDLERAAAVEAERALAERAARSRVSDRLAAAAALRRDLEVRAASVEERRTLLTRRLDEVERRLERNVSDRQQAEVRRTRLEAEAAVIVRLAGEVERHRGVLDGMLERLRAARRDELAATRARTDRLEALRRNRATVERQLGDLRERLGRVEIDDNEARVRLQTLTETVRRDLDCEPEATRHAPPPELPPGTSATSRRAELERELRLMGPINPLALEEHQALQERHQFLEAQLEDVRSARRELTKVIRAVDAEIIEVFRAAWADVSAHFESLFSTLFPGGEGRLRLTDPENVLETGIEVEARPSGKNVRRLSLLSGGERSLVAMAFLFAVFRSRPSPFYLMDEVEAALDDVNLRRFLDLLEEFRGEAQLLVVSHQKRTMEAADCLYGVTMAPGGSSRVVSEKVGSAAS